MVYFDMNIFTCLFEELMKYTDENSIDSEIEIIIEMVIKKNRYLYPDESSVQDSYVNYFTFCALSIIFL